MMMSLLLLLLDGKLLLLRRRMPLCFVDCLRPRDATRHSCLHHVLLQLELLLRHAGREGPALGIAARGGRECGGTGELQL